MGLAAMLAGGLHGIEQELELEDPIEGNAYTSDKTLVPSTLRDARDAFAASEIAPQVFGAGGRRPLPQRRRRGAQGVQHRRHRLGAGPGVRAAVSTTHVVLDPATEQPVVEIEQTTLEQTDAAIERAASAFRTWRTVDPADRGRLLRRFAEAVDGAQEELAALEVRNSGHTISNARWEAGNVRDVLTYYSAAPERLFGRQIPVGGGVNLTFKEPLGVVGVIVPWNFPMPILGWGMAPALAAGNTVVLKPAELTPLTAIRIGELALEAGLPEGVLTVLPGKGSVVGERFVTHPAVRKICFTGSTEVGTRIMARAAEQVKRVTLELGGKSANIVFADSDLEKAAATAPYGVFDNAGQDCCARSRILVERSVHDRFLGPARARGPGRAGRRAR